MAKKVMELLDEYSGLMRCRVCGGEHKGTLVRSRLLGNGTRRYYFRRSDWKCENGCSLPEPVHANADKMAGVVKIAEVA